MARRTKKRNVLQSTVFIVCSLLIIFFLLGWLLLNNRIFRNRAAGENVSLSCTAAPSTVNTDYVTTFKANSQINFTTQGYKFKVKFDPAAVQVKDIAYKLGTVSNGLGQDNSALTQINASGVIQIQGELQNNTGQVITANTPVDVVAITTTSNAQPVLTIDTTSSDYFVQVQPDATLNFLNTDPSPCNGSNGAPTATPTTVIGGGNPTPTDTPIQSQPTPTNTVAPQPTTPVGQCTPAPDGDEDHDGDSSTSVITCKPDGSLKITWTGGGTRWLQIKEGNKWLFNGWAKSGVVISSIGNAGQVTINTKGKKISWHTNLKVQWHLTQCKAGTNPPNNNCKAFNAVCTSNANCCSNICNTQTHTCANQPTPTPTTPPAGQGQGSLPIH